MGVWDGAHGPEREGCEHLADGSSARVTLGSELHSAQNTGLSSQVLEAERGQVEKTSGTLGPQPNPRPDPQACLVLEWFCSQALSCQMRSELAQVSGTTSRRGR